MLDLSYALSHAAVCRHEAGRAAAFLAMGILPKSLDVSGQGQYRGVVTVSDDWRVITNSADAVKEAINTICAWLCEGVEPPDWPLDSGAITSVDQRNLDGLARTFGWDESSYKRVIAAAKNLMASEAFQRAYNTLGALCQYKAFITEDEMRPLLASPKPRVERRGFHTIWQTKSAAPRRQRLDARAVALRQVDEIMARWQDHEAATVAKEFERC